MNLPNKLTTLRVIMIPFFVVFMLADMGRTGDYIALALFCLASLTDFFDFQAFFQHLTKLHCFRLIISITNTIKETPSISFSFVSFSGKSSELSLTTLTFFA